MGGSVCVIKSNYFLPFWSGLTSSRYSGESPGSQKKGFHGLHSHYKMIRNCFTLSPTLHSFMLLNTFHCTKMPHLSYRYNHTSSIRHPVTLTSNHLPSLFKLQAKQIFSHEPMGEEKNSNTLLFLSTSRAVAWEVPLGSYSGVRVHMCIFPQKWDLPPRKDFAQSGNHKDKALMHICFAKETRGSVAGQMCSL